MALTAEIVFEALAIGGLGEHAGKREFADAAGPAEEQRVRDAVGTKHAAQCGDDAFIAEKLGEAHGSANPWHGGLGDRGRNSGEDFCGDLLWGAHGGARLIEALNDGPIGTAGELIVHGSSIFEVAEAGFLDVFFFAGVRTRGLAADENLSLVRRNAKIENEGFAGKLVDAVFEMFDPGDESVALRGRNTSSLVSEIRTDVAIGEDDLALC